MQRTKPLKRVPFPVPLTASGKPVWSSLPSTGGIARTAPLARSRTVKSAATRTGSTISARAESFPPAVAALLAARDPWCVHCGSPHDLQNHHRRIRGIGGDSRPHTHCACNGVRLCVLCHVPWAHKNRLEAEAEGIVIPRSELAPWRRSLMVHTAADSGFTAYPTCDGGWVFEAPEGVGAA